MFARISETRDVALEAVERARERLSGGREQAGKKMTEVKTQVFGAFKSLFGGGGKKPAPGPVAQQGGSQGSAGGRGGAGNAPVARAVPRQGQNM